MEMICVEKDVHELHLVVFSGQEHVFHEKEDEIDEKMSVLHSGLNDGVEVET